MTKLISRAEAARQCGVSAYVVEQAVRRGEIRTRRLSKREMLVCDDVMRWRMSWDPSQSTEPAASIAA